jgi:putative methionine-R-sulfoxide reductase with GAF domain
MAAITSELPAGLRNRRRRVRHKIQTPAYASFTGESRTAMLDLYEILDISEEGVSIQCPEPLDADRHINLCLDLAECSDHVYTTGRVVWSSDNGRVGLHFSELPPASLFRLREWLFLNAMAGIANAEVDPVATQHVPAVPNYTDTLAAVSAVQREVEALGADLQAALQLIAERAETLVRASGAALALATADPEVMDCRASSGNDAPPVGARLQVGSGFSGECVKTGKSLRCDDSEIDERVDRESCRTLGIRSILAIPIRVGEKSIGILEAFSPAADAFTDTDSKVLQRLAESVVPAVNRAARAENLPPLVAQEVSPRFDPLPGSVLFAAEPEEETKIADTKTFHGISLPRTHLILLVCAACVISLVLGLLSAPTIQSDVIPWLQNWFHPHSPTQLQTVLASSQPPKSENSAASTGSGSTQPAAVDGASLDELRQMAEKGDAAAENSLGLRYFEGDAKAGLKPDEKTAAHWFTVAAEDDNLAAQSKLGFLYYSGNHGLPKDLPKAYFWTTVACSRSGDTAKDPAVPLSKAIQPVLRSQLTREQAASIEHQAQQWVQQHDAATKPTAGH